MNKKLFDKSRKLSWSAISSFEYDPEQWYRKYVLGEEQKETPEMRFGKKLADELENGKCTISELVKKLPYKKEHEFSVMFGTINLVGFADDFDHRTFKVLNEVKTGKKAWDQKRVNGHRQFDMYLLMNYITNKIKPEEVKCSLHWIPTQDNGDFTISFVEPIQVHTFETKRTMHDILLFGQRIKNTFLAMEEYAKNHI